MTMLYMPNSNGLTGQNENKRFYKDIQNIYESLKGTEVLQKGFSYINLNIT
jgi:hypothetical protein